MEKEAKTKTIIIVKPKIDFQLLSNNIARNKKLTDSAVRVYVFINSHSDTFILSYNNIAKALNKSETTIKKAIKELKQSGFLELERIEKSNNYRYLIFNDTDNYEYKLEQDLKNNVLDFTDIKAIYKILNNEKITKETRDEINKKLQKILKAEWINSD